MTKDREELIDHIKTVFPIVPSNIRGVLTLMTHPDVVHISKEYFEEMALRNLPCLTYDDPWSCEAESNAKYETIYMGMADEGFSDVWREGWCNHCKQRVGIL